MKQSRKKWEGDSSLKWQHMKRDSMRREIERMRPRKMRLEWILKMEGNMTKKE